MRVAGVGADDIYLLILLAPLFVCLVYLLGWFGWFGLVWFGLKRYVYRHVPK